MEKEVRESTKKLRELVVNAYKEVLKEHGKYASRLQKSELYEEVSQLPYITCTAGTVGNIIREHFKSERNKA